MNLFPVLGALDENGMNLQVPDSRTRNLFAEEVELVDLTGEKTVSTTFFTATRNYNRIRWNIGTGTRKLRAELRIWDAFFSKVNYLDHVHFYAISGRFLGEQHERFQTPMGIEAKARMKDGEDLWVKALMTVDWVLRATPETGASTWEIVSWKTTEFLTSKADARQPLFEDVTDIAIPAKETLSQARSSPNEQLAIEFIKSDGKNAPHPHYQPQSWDRHPGVSIVDIDRDGFDDIYMMDRFGPNMLLRNRGNSTFDNVAQQYGLDILGHSSAAIFADFDNDGDADLFLARSLARSVYLVNNNGTFVDRSADLINAPLPFLASSVSAADYDRDGLLDIHISTYGAQFINADGLKSIAEFLSPEEHTRLNEIVKKMVEEGTFNGFLNIPGPPNMLLRNVGGGKFEVQGEETIPALYRNTYQSSWSDYDNDGDPDLYCVNDFAADVFYRNEGNGKLTDVTESLGLISQGFGMGVSWGDYDRDGLFDIYVSNMYSKAGRRITAGIANIDPRFSQAAEGNTLFRNTGSGFTKVSGDAPDALKVHKSGWSWGGQFLDFDNDCDLDIFALSGFYTAPKEIVLPGDT